MYDHTIPTSVFNTDRTHISFNGTEYEIDPETGGVRIPIAGRKHSGRFALVDVQDLAQVADRSWHGLATGRVVYAQSRQMVDGKPRVILMHRVILGVVDRRIQVDHINHNGLDNRRCNLRLATNQSNSFNRRPKLGGSSQYKGVYWDKSKDKWCVSYTLNGRSRKAGCFGDEKEAARAYDAAIREHHGSFAWLNFPDEGRGDDEMKS